MSAAAVARAASSPPLFAALCLVGQLRARGGDAKAHWAHQRAFAQRLMLGSDWLSLHVWLVSDAEEAEIQSQRRLLSSLWQLPEEHVHALAPTASPEALLERRCRNATSWQRNATIGEFSPRWERNETQRQRNGTQRQRGGPVPICEHERCWETLMPALRAFYAQADKAEQCYEGVKRLEAEWAARLVSHRARGKRGRGAAAAAPPRFEFVLRMRTDWPFEAAPPLISFQGLGGHASVYSSLRCAANHPDSRHRALDVPPAYYMRNQKSLMAVGGGCPLGAWYVGDQLLITPRHSADFLFYASRLPCPMEEAKVVANARKVCKLGGGAFANPMAECFLHLGILHRAQLRPQPAAAPGVTAASLFRGLTFGPIPVTWASDRKGFPLLPWQAAPAVRPSP